MFGLSAFAEVPFSALPGVSNVIAFVPTGPYIIEAAAVFSPGPIAAQVDA